MASKRYCDVCTKELPEGSLDTVSWSNNQGHGMLGYTNKWRREKKLPEFKFFSIHDVCYTCNDKIIAAIKRLIANAGQVY